MWLRSTSAIFTPPKPPSLEPTAWFFMGVFQGSQIIQREFQQHRRSPLSSKLLVFQTGQPTLSCWALHEIPSGHTINPLRWCDDIPGKLHLQLRNYLYLFEFCLDDNSWRALVHRYRAGKTRYAQFRQTDDLLDDSGWHCSFCFPHIRELYSK